MKKHQENATLILAERYTFDHLLSKAINDSHVSDNEFQITVSELEQYNVLKGKVRAKLNRHSSCKTVATKPVDVEKIKTQICTELEAAF